MLLRASGVFTWAVYSEEVCLRAITCYWWIYIHRLVYSDEVCLFMAIRAIGEYT